MFKSYSRDGIYFLVDTYKSKILLGVLECAFWWFLINTLITK